MAGMDHVDTRVTNWCTTCDSMEHALKARFAPGYESGVCARCCHTYLTTPPECQVPEPEPSYDYDTNTCTATAGETITVTMPESYLISTEEEEMPEDKTLYEYVIIKQTDDSDELVTDIATVFADDVEQVKLMAIAASNLSPEDVSGVEVLVRPFC